MQLKLIVAALSGLLFASQISAQVPIADPEQILHLDLSTGGRVTIQLRPDVAPRHVERIKHLVRQNFYSGIIFHRVIEGFMAQAGDPGGTGVGGSSLPDIAAEFNALPHLRGTVSMARSNDPNSANSQFFIMLAPNMALDGQYTAFGRVIGGMAYVDAIPKGAPPKQPATILRASIAADNIPPVSAMPVPTAAPPAPSIPPSSSPQR